MTRGRCFERLEDKSNANEFTLEESRLMIALTQPTPIADTPSYETEQALVEALKRRDELAFDKLVEDNRRRLLGVAYRIVGNFDDSLDVVQEAFLAAYIALPKFRGSARLSTWLHRITVNAALQFVRKRRQARESSLDDEGDRLQEVPDAGRRDPESRLAEKQQARIACTKLRNISRTHREVFVMRYLLEHDTEATARSLAITPNAVKIRLHRACLALREAPTESWRQSA